MSDTGTLVFLGCAIVALVSGVLTVSMQSPLRAAMALLLHILSLAGLYLTLHAHLLAAIQLLVYAGAVVVLFIFVIMLIGPSAMPERSESRSVYVRAMAACLMLMVGGVLSFGVAASVDAEYVDIDQCAEGVAECHQYGGVDAVSEALFQGAAVPFELISILLLVAIIAAVAVARGHTAEEKRAFEARRAAVAQSPEAQGKE